MLQTLPAPLPEGLMPRLVSRLFFRAARVADKQALAPGLHLVTLEGDALRDAAWTPGDKLQVKTGTGLVMRTYTPIDWDAEAGRTRILAHALAWGPGSEWAQRVQPGDRLAVFGPRRSLDLAGFDRADMVFVGDETSIALSAAWRPARSVFEVDRLSVMRTALDLLALPATAVARRAADGHRGELADAALAGAGPATRFVLTGRAATIQALLRDLRRRGVASGRIRTKAYWADGKAGLD